MNRERVHVSVRQLEMLTDYMMENKQLALGTLRSKEGYALSRMLWEECAHRLNSHGNPRSRREWARYWADYKSRTKRKYQIIKRAQEENSPCNIELMPSEQKIIQILENDSISNTFQQDPLCEEEKDDNIHDMTQDEEQSNIYHHHQPSDNDDGTINAMDIKFDIEDNSNHSIDTTHQDHDYASAQNETCSPLRVDLVSEGPQVESTQERTFRRLRLRDEEVHRDRTAIRRRRVHQQGSRTQSQPYRSKASAELARLRLEDRRLEIELLKAKAEEKKAEASLLKAREQGRIAGALESIASTIRQWNGIDLI